jgi:hypothetical protein
LCSNDVHAVDWSSILASRGALNGQIVHVRGPLGVHGFGKTLMGCEATDGEGCCNGVWGHIVLGGEQFLELPGLGCSGDDSAQCCDAPAFGQTVVATGLLVATRLEGAKLCVEPNR